MPPLVYLRWFIALVRSRRRRELRIGNGVDAPNGHAIGRRYTPEEARDNEYLVPYSYNSIGGNVPWPMLFMSRMPGPVSLQGRHPPGPGRRASLASAPSRTRSGLAVASYLSRCHASASSACFRGHGCVRGLGSRGNACRAHPRRHRPQAPFAEGWRTKMAHLNRNRNRNHRSSRMMTRRLIRRRPSVGGRCSTLKG